MDDELKKSKLVRDKAEKKYRKALKKIPKKQRLVDVQNQKSKLHFDDNIKIATIKTPKKESVVSKKIVNTSFHTMNNARHKEIERTEDDNVSVKALHTADKTVEFVGGRLQKAYKKQKQAPFEKLKEAETKLKKARINHKFEQQISAYKTSNPVSRKYQKFKLKREYSKKYRDTVKTTKNTTSMIKTGTTKITNVVTTVVKNPKVILILIAIFLVIVLVASSASIVSIFFQGATNSVLGTSYTAEKDDMIDINDNYVSFESDLQEEIDNIPTTHSGYDEYIYNLDEIGHNGHELMSYLTALNQHFTKSSAQSEIQKIFGLQYELSFQTIVEVRYSTETFTDSEGNEYTEEVPYDYYILITTLENVPIKDIAKNLLTSEQYKMFEIYLEQKGNYPDLFGDIYSEEDPNNVPHYQVPAHYMTDVQFGKMLTEAEKYLGYPYVWGGSNPSNSFDCSGFVCWVLNESDSMDISRTTAYGIYTKTQRIAPNEAKAGDIIFFTGTYNSGTPVSHVGIYVGDGMMIHCGNPIGYARVDSGYWKDKFYAFGRIE